MINIDSRSKSLLHELQDFTSESTKLSQINSALTKLYNDALDEAANEASKWSSELAIRALKIR